MKRPSSDTPPITIQRRLAFARLNMALAGTRKKNAVARPVASHSHHGQTDMAAPIKFSATMAVASDATPTRSQRVGVIGRRNNLRAGK